MKKCSECEVYFMGDGSLCDDCEGVSTDNFDDVEDDRNFDHDVDEDEDDENAWGDDD